MPGIIRSKHMAKSTTAVLNKVKIFTLSHSSLNPIRSLAGYFFGIKKKIICIIFTVNFNVLYAHCLLPHIRFVFPLKSLLVGTVLLSAHWLPMKYVRHSHSPRAVMVTHGWPALLGILSGIFLSIWPERNSYQRIQTLLLDMYIFTDRWVCINRHICDLAQF